MSSITEDETPRLPMPRWMLGLCWIATTSAGWAVGVGILPFLEPALEGRSPSWVWLRLPFIILGLTIGSLQVPCLPKGGRARLLWVVGTSLGVCASFVFTDGELLKFALGGTLLGTLQWVVLRRSFTSAAWWIPASASGLVFSGRITLGAVMLADVDGRSSASSIGIGALAGAVHGLATGMVWLQLTPKGTVSAQGGGDERTASA